MKLGRVNLRTTLALLIGCGLLAGLTQLRFSTDLLGLLPADAPGVHALRIWDRHFSGAHQLTLTLAGDDADALSQAARELAQGLRRRSNLVDQVHWQPVWRDDPDHGAGFLAWQWMNQTPAAVAELQARLASTNLVSTLAATQEALQFSLSPEDLARRAYDPLGLGDLPVPSSRLAEPFRHGDGGFASADGRFRRIVLQPVRPLMGFGEASLWLEDVRREVNRLRSEVRVPDTVRVRYTGGPAIAAETSHDMERDMRGSVGGTTLVVAAMFALAHRRLLPLLWMQGLLALILVLTLGFAGWVLGTLNVVSLGFASILLGLVDDFGLVLYQELRTTPNRTLAGIRSEHFRAILASAFTTAIAFLLLNLSGVPGLAQLGTLVALGTVTAAVVILALFLQPFLRPPSAGANADPTNAPPAPSNLPPVATPATAGSVTTTTTTATTVGALTAAPDSDPDLALARRTLWATALLALLAGTALFLRAPRFDVTQDALRPRGSESYAALDELRDRLEQHSADIWLVFAGASEIELAARFDRARAALESLVARGRLEHFTLPEAVWPSPDHWAANRPSFRALAERRPELLSALRTAGFQGGALEQTDRVLSRWADLARRPNPTAPEDATGRWVREQVFARDREGAFALGLARPGPNASAADVVREIEAAAGPGLHAGSWEALGPGLRLHAGKRGMWLTLLMTVLVASSLALTYRNARAVAASLGVLFFGGFLLWGWMAIAGWHWNLMNLLALPLLLGAGVDFAIHQQTALARYPGDRRRVRQGTSRAIWLGGLTTVVGFGSLAGSTNTGLASLGQVCAMGVLCVLATAQWLLPGWWILLGRPSAGPLPAATESAASEPSRLYGPQLWFLAVSLARVCPAPILRLLATSAARLYGRLDRARFEIVARNLAPATQGNAAARDQARALFHEFGRKLVDLWRFEAGRVGPDDLGDLRGRHHLEAALASGRGVLLVTLHLGNWELGATALARFGKRLLVLTRAEPGGRFTEQRRAARARLGIDTLVVGDSPFAFVEVIRRLSEGGLVALLIDRPDAATAVETRFLGRSIDVSRAPAELARAAACTVLPVTIVRVGSGYRAEVLPPVPHDRRALGSASARAQFAGEILRAFEPSVRQHPEQWFHFVPIWPDREPT